jgi:hypothetical protein
MYQQDSGGDRDGSPGNKTVSTTLLKLEKFREKTLIIHTHYPGASLKSHTDPKSNSFHDTGEGVNSPSLQTYHRFNLHSFGYLLNSYICFLLGLLSIKERIKPIVCD